MVLCACRINFDPLGDGGATPLTITFGERPTSQRKNVTTDARLEQAQPVRDYGGGEDLSVASFVGSGEHAVLRFDLSSLPAGTLVVAARLSLTRLDYGDETLGTVVLSLVGESWQEGTGTGTNGTGVSWSTRDGTQPWATAGGTSLPPVVTFMPSLASVVALDPASIQRWVDEPTTNAGFLFAMASNDTHLHFHASESPLVGMMARPELALDIVQ